MIIPELNKLNTREAHFVKKIMAPLGVIPSGLQLQFLKRLLDQRYNEVLTIPAAKTMIGEIIYKIADAEMDNELDEVLSNPSYGDDQPTTATRKFALTQKHVEILEYLRAFPNTTRRDLSTRLGRPINCITPRVRELLDENLIQVSGTTWDHGTSRQVQCLKVVN